MTEGSQIAMLVKKIQGMKKGADFSPYIDYIVFPRYRGISPGQRIDFTFPLTVLVGRNGTGKSSVLHALHGAPYRQSVAQYWFGTAVDPVETGETVEVEEEAEGGGKRKLREEQKAAFWYGYREGGVELQAIKQRVRRERVSGFETQEYWEPSRPNESYGMRPIPRSGAKRDRHPQIKMPVQYLSLRYHLSAFDRCFNFLSTAAITRYERTRHWKALGGGRPTKQDYIRGKAVRLARAFGRQTPLKSPRSTLALVPRRLTSGDLKLISAIVGKEYKAGTTIQHRLYDDIWAESVRFDADAARYTEANAGSGETAVLQIVRLFESAEENSLLLLDEPETSLHPGAQRELLRYILEQIAKKKLQVVISTHAPDLVRQLPRDAVKLLRRGDDGLVAIDQRLSVEEAFYEIGHPFDPTCNVIVEDRLAKQVLDAIARAKGDAFAAKLRVEFRPGGHSEMKKDVATFIHGHHKPVFVFDGDQSQSNVDPDKLPMGDTLNSDKLDEVIATQTGQKIQFKQNSRMSPADKSSLRLDYLRYFQKRVFYLPFASPEAVVWNDDVAKGMLQTFLVTPSAVASAMDDLSRQGDYKEKFKSLARALGHGDLHPEAVHTLFVTRFVSGGGSAVDAVMKLLVDVVAAAEVADA